MKYIKTYEKIEHRRVYWIVPFDNKFEDSLVRLKLQYTAILNMGEKIAAIDDSLNLANHARENLPEDNLAIITMEFKIKDEEVTYGPIFNIVSITKKETLDKLDYIFVGYHNITEEEYKIYSSMKKYNV